MVPPGIPYDPRSPARWVRGLKGAGTPHNLVVTFGFGARFWVAHDLPEAHDTVSNKTGGGGPPTSPRGAVGEAGRQTA